jgi:hypothetical protein
VTTPPQTLGLERKRQENYTTVAETGENVVMMFGPLVGEDYWQYRVKITDTQAVVGFPKYNTIGIGFQVEEADPNTNLPFTELAEQITDHIWHNHGPSIPEDEDWKITVTAAIAIIQNAIIVDNDL